jgi:hypothetical protein
VKDQQKIKTRSQKKPDMWVKQEGRWSIDGVSRKSKGERERERKEKEKEKSLPPWIDGGSVVLHRRKWRNKAPRGNERGVMKTAERERSENGRTTKKV